MEDPRWTRLLERRKRRRRRGEDVRAKHGFDGGGGRGGSGGTALEDLNDAAEEVNKAEHEYDRGKRMLREEKEREGSRDGMYKQLGGAVKKAVPALHKGAVASLYQNRSQEAMIAHAGVRSPREV